MFEYSCVHVKCIFVLIDTWWNVNLIFISFYLSGYAVLIDTWWNVNPSALRTPTIFNSVLIDTWWNVNAF